MYHKGHEEENNYTKLQPKKGIKIESMYNEEFDIWEVSMDDSLMGTYQTEESASKAVEQIYIAFETGYMNGMLLGFIDKDEAKKALKDRGVEFITEFDFED